MARKFVVIKGFKDLEDNNHIYSGGNFYPREGAELDEARADALASGDNVRNEQLIVEVLVEKEPEKEPEEPGEGAEYPKPTGGGYYELSNGEKVRGKDKAIAAEKELAEK